MSGEYRTYGDRTYVGGYRIGGITGLQFNFTEKPIWLHRKMMKWCLGWEWVDGVNNGS